MKITDLFKKIEAYNEIANYTYAKKASVILHDHNDNTVMKFYNVGQLRRYIKAYHDVETAKQIMRFEGWDFGTPFTFASSESETFTYSIRVVPRDGDIRLYK